nr:hypothetical protein [Tanacetum cinerariifolium]
MAVVAWRWDEGDGGSGDDDGMMRWRWYMIESEDDVVMMGADDWWPKIGRTCAGNRGDILVAWRWDEGDGGSGDDDGMMRWR